MTYGFSEDADVRVEDYQQIGRSQGHFTLLRQDKEPMRVTLNAPGRHQRAERRSCGCGR
ncbi:hypothetical protein ACLB1Q_16060 [Escherichia coli]